MTIEEKKESIERREQIIRNMLISFYEDCKNNGDFVPMFANRWAKKIRKEVEKS